MPQETVTTSPLDAQYTAHRETEQNREETREWLKQRERELGLAKDEPRSSQTNSAGPKSRALANWRSNQAVGDLAKQSQKRPQALGIGYYVALFAKLNPQQPRNLSRIVQSTLRKQVR
jgi:hypothetical protein